MWCSWTYILSMSKEVVKPERATSEGGPLVENAEVPQCKYSVNKRAMLRSLGGGSSQTQN